MNDAPTGNSSVSSKPVIGLAGGIGSGKSTVAAEFVRLGCTLIDGDVIGHDILANPLIRRRLRDRWGESIFDDEGLPARPLIADIVFNDPVELAWLNHLTHPHIRARIEKLIEDNRVDPDVPAIVLDAAVMFEAGWDDLCTHLIFVECPLELRLDRVKKTRKWNKDMFDEREKMQFSLDRKCDKCCYKIVNGSGLSALRKQAHQLFSQIMQAGN